MIIAQKTKADILGSNINKEEADIPVYDSSIDYALKDIVQIDGETNRLYEALQAVSKDTPITNPLTDVNPTTGIGTYWFDRGATNYMRAFDELGSSKCSNSDEIYYKFGISDIDVLFFGGLENVKTIRVVVTNIADSNNPIVVMDKTIDTSFRDVYDWFDWVYTPTEFKKSLFVKLPLVFNSTLEVYLDNENESVSVGHIAYGRGKDVGLTLISPSPVVSSRGVTSKSRDRFGNIITRRKARYKRMTISCSIKALAIDMIQNRLEDLVDKALIIVGDDRDKGYESLSIYGELKDHDMPIGISITQYQLEVEGYL